MRLATPMAAMRLGIATIYQELDLVNDLTVAENITLGHEPSRLGFAERRTERNAAVALLEAPRPPGDLPERRRRDPVGRRQADRQHGESAVPRREADDHGRAVRRPRPGRGRPAVRGDPGPDRQRRRRHLHLAPARGDPGDRRSGDRAQGRPHGGHRPAGQDHPHRRCHPADDGPHHRVRLPAAQRAGRSPAPRCSTCRASRGAGEFEDVTFTVHAGEVVGLAGLVGSGRSEILETVYGARRFEAGLRAASTASHCAAGSVPAAVDAGVGLCPEERKSQALLLDQTVVSNVTLPSLRRFAVGPFMRRSQGGAGSRQRDPEPGRAPGGSAARRAHPLGRQPAEGRARALAAQGLPGAAARRADARRRRRRPERALRPHPQPGRLRGRRRSWSAARCPRCSACPTGCWSCVMAASSTTARQARSKSPMCSDSSWREAHDERFDSDRRRRPVRHPSARDDSRRRGVGPHGDLPRIGRPQPRPRRGPGHPDHRRHRHRR